MPQNDYIELHQKRFGHRMDEDEKKRKKEARMAHVVSRQAQNLRGIKAKIFNKERFKEKARMKKLIKQHEEKDVDVKTDEVKEGALPTFLMDREQAKSSKILANSIKQKRK